MTERTKIQVRAGVWWCAGDCLIILASGVIILLGIIVLLVDMPIWAWVIVLAGECVACIPLHAKLVRWNEKAPNQKEENLPLLDITVVYKAKRTRK